MPIQLVFTEYEDLVLKDVHLIADVREKFLPVCLIGGEPFQGGNLFVRFLAEFLVVGDTREDGCAAFAGRDVFEGVSVRLLIFRS